MLDFFKLLLMLKTSSPILVEPVEEVRLFQRRPKTSFLLALQRSFRLETVVDSNFLVKFAMRRIPIEGLWEPVIKKGISHELFLTRHCRLLRGFCQSRAQRNLGLISIRQFRLSLVWKGIGRVSISRQSSSYRLIIGLSKGTVTGRLASLVALIARLVFKRAAKGGSNRLRCSHRDILTASWRSELGSEVMRPLARVSRTLCLWRR